MRANLLGYDNSQAIHECYLAGLHNAKSYATEKDWLTSLKNECNGKPLPEIVLPEAQKVFTVAAGDVVNDCGSWTIIDEDGIWITDRRYGHIVIDPATGKLTAGLYGYSIDKHLCLTAQTQVFVSTEASVCQLKSKCLSK